MRIGFFTDTYLPVVHGMEISIETFRKNLQRMGHEVFVYAPTFPGYKDKNPNVFRFPSLRVVKKPEMRLAIPFSIKNHLKDIINFKLDIVHTHSPFSMAWLGKYIALHQGIPLVYTHHTRYTEYAKSYILKEKLLSPFVAKELVRWYANVCDAVIAPSYKIKRLLIAYGIKAQMPIFVLPTGVNPNIFKKSPEQGKKLREELNIASQKKILLFVGRMGSEKNPEFLLKVVKKIAKVRKDTILLMVGDGPILNNLRKISHEKKIDENVKFVGAIPHKEIPKYYQASDVFVFSSLTDTQGIVILEAAACGLPIVALKDDAFKQMVISGKNGFIIERQSTIAFAKKVMELLDKPSLYRKFSQASRSIAKKFSEEETAKQLVNIYKELIKQSQLKNKKVKNQKISSFRLFPSY